MTEAPKVLIVDDEGSLCAALAKLLSKLPAKVEIAGTGDGAIDLLLSQSSKEKPYRVIILDLWLPKNPGEPVDAELGRSTLTRVVRYFQLVVPGTPIIVFTAHPKLESCVECMRSGAFDYLDKTDPERNNVGVLIEKVRGILYPDQAPNEIEQWFERNRDQLSTFAGKCIAPIPEAVARKAGINDQPLNGFVILVEESMKALALRFLHNHVLRWEKPQFIDLPKSPRFEGLC